MPPSQEPKQKSLAPWMDEVDYPPHAFEFIHEGLDFTVTRAFAANMPTNRENRHVSGQQLCEGLRELALARWGRMARTVLKRWNVNSTLDFGRIVFTLIEMGQMQKVEEDTLEDFKNVYDFESAFEAGYRFPSHS